jgi:hypothetical protein
LVHTVNIMNCSTLRCSCTATPLCAFMGVYRATYTFTFTIVRCPVGHCTIRSAATCAVPGFAPWRAAQVSAVTAPCVFWGRPPWEARRGALSEEGTTKH